MAGVSVMTEGERERSESENLRERVAIVTGGSRGIGRGIALHLASLGARLVVNYSSHDSTQADQLVNQINQLCASSSSYKHHYSSSSSSSSISSHSFSNNNNNNNNNSQIPRAAAVRGDISDPAQVKSLFDKAEEIFGGPPHILVNSAGVLDPKYPSIANTSVDDFDRVFGVNAKGAFLCCREAANRLKRGGGGRIIMLSSSQVGALRPGFGPYAASKAAVEAMVKILAKELKGTRITANCVAPGPIATDMFFSGKTEDDVKKAVEQCPLGRLGEVQDVVPLVGFLASDASEWVNGQVIRANGGYV